MPKKNDFAWTKTTNNLLIHNALFNKGIVVTKPLTSTQDLSANYTTEESYKFENRELVLVKASDLTNQPDGYTLQIQDLESLGLKNALTNATPKKTFIIDPSYGLFEFNEKGAIRKIFDLEILKKNLIHLNLGYLLKGNLKNTDSIEKQISYAQLTKLNKLLADHGTNKLKLPNIDNRNVKLQRNLLNMLTNNSSSNLLHKLTNNNPQPVFFNPKRRDEIFFPYIVEHKVKRNPKKEINLEIKNDDEYTEKKFSGYYYIWTTDTNNNKKDQLQAFKIAKFQSNGCLKGGPLKGKNQNGIEYCIIKHELKFFPGEKIVEIVLEKAISKGISEYDKMLFTEFKNTAALIASYSHAENKQLLYHLPAYDYIIFIGVELFTRGRMTLAAFNELCSVILKTKNEHVKAITGICNQFDIKVTFSSPFDNLLKPLDNYLESYKQLHEFNNIKSKEEVHFEDMELEDSSFDDFPYEDVDSDDEMDESESMKNPKLGEQFPADLGEQVLKILGLSCTELPTPIDDESQIASSQRNLVNIILTKLTNNQYDIVQQEVWKDFKQCSQIETLEKLVQNANAVMIAIAAKDNEDFKTCSIVPLSEKQVQVSYSDFNKRYRKYCTENKNNANLKISKYPPVVNIDTLDTLVTYQSKCMGNPFYTDLNLGEVHDAKLLKYAHKNIFFSATGVGTCTPKECLNNSLDDYQIKALRSS